MKSKTNFKQMYLVDHKFNQKSPPIPHQSPTIYPIPQPLPIPYPIPHQSPSTYHQTSSTLGDAFKSSSFSQTQRETKLNNKNTPSHTTEAGVQTITITTEASAQTTPITAEASAQTTPITAETDVQTTPL